MNYPHHLDRQPYLNHQPINQNPYHLTFQAPYFYNSKCLFNLAKVVYIHKLF